jgi:glycerophosphoryl diester phosphodiesterase
MKWANSHRLKVNTWTVNDPTEADYLSKLGVNAIITNVPDILRDALG